MDVKFLPSLWQLVYADDDDGQQTQGQQQSQGEQQPQGEPQGEPQGTKQPDSKKEDGPDGVKVFSQTDVERIVKQRLKKQQEDQKKLIGEVNALKAKSDLTTEERKEWEERIEQLNNSLLSEQELRAKELKRKEEEHKSALTEREQEIEKWRGLFTSSTITRSLTDAAVDYKALHPEQIVSLLDRRTRLVEELNDGKPTGRLVPRVRFEDTDDKGKPVTLEISPSEAVKRMTEIGKYQNLFEGKGTGGVGTRSHAEGGKKQNLANLAKDPGAYIKARREGQVQF